MVKGIRNKQNRKPIMNLAETKFSRNSFLAIFHIFSCSLSFYLRLRLYLWLRDNQLDRLGLHSYLGIIVFISCRLRCFGFERVLS